MDTKKSNPVSQQQKNKQNRKPCVSRSGLSLHAKDVRVNLRKAKFKSRRPVGADYEQKCPVKSQPSRSYDDIPSDYEEEGQNFNTLLNVPVSDCGYFNFRGEKDWSCDISKSSDFFSINLKLLNTAVSCIPFNECIGLSDKYLSMDVLTYMRSEAETAKTEYSKILKTLHGQETSYSGQEDFHKPKSEDIIDNQTITSFPKSRNINSLRENENQGNSKIEDIEDDLDSLLTLKEPDLTRKSVILKSTHTVQDNIRKSANVPTKSIDLEKWLDSVLDS